MRVKRGHSVNNYQESLKRVTCTRRKVRNLLKYQKTMVKLNACLNNERVRCGLGRKYQWPKLCYNIY